MPSKRRPLLYIVSAAAGGLMTLAVGIYQLYFVPSGEATRIASPLADSKRFEVQAPGECRLPSHGIETYAKEDQVIIDSGWIGGGSSPGQFCEQKRRELESQRRDHEIVALASQEKSIRKLLFTVRYRYTCIIRDRSDPVYKLALDEACPKLPPAPPPISSAPTGSRRPGP